MHGVRAWVSNDTPKETKKFCLDYFRFNRLGSFEPPLTRCVFNYPCSANYRGRLWSPESFKSRSVGSRYGRTQACLRRSR